MLAAAGLAPTSVDGLAVDPFTGLPASNSLLEDLMVDPAGLGSVRCETDRGVPLHPHDVLTAALAGHVRRGVLDSNGHIIDFGRRKRLFEGPVRDAAKLLITRCQHPGCDLPAGWSQVDHNTEWGDHGHADQDNAGVLCAKHNTAKHRLGLHPTTRCEWHRLHDPSRRHHHLARRSTHPPVDQHDDPDDRPDTPDDIARLDNLARERLRAWCAEDNAA